MNTKRIRTETQMTRRIPELPNMDRAYWDIYKDIEANGHVFVHRGAECVEVRPYSFTLLDPSDGLYTGKKRRMNYRFWAVETLMYIAGWGTYKEAKAFQLLTKVNSNYNNFSTDHKLNGMVKYGDGFGQGLMRAYDTLKENRYRRQAYVSIWNRDTPHSYEDSPCLIGAQYFVEKINNSEGLPEDRLSALYNIRSNDLNWGVPYDVASNCAIQCLLADCLCIDVGYYYHTACSMHYYRNGNMGETPPNIEPVRPQSYLKDAPFIPRSPQRMSMQEANFIADFMLDELHTHLVVDCKPGHRFVSLQENASDWAKAWGDVVRWSWPKDGANA